MIRKIKINGCEKSYDKSRIVNPLMVKLLGPIELYASRGGWM